MPELLLSDGLFSTDQPNARYAYRQSLHSRVSAFLLALAMSVFVLTILLWMGVIDAPPQFAGSHLTSVSLSETRGAVKAQTAAKVAAVAQAVQPSPPILLPPRLMKPPTVKLPSFDLIRLTRQEMAAADIGKMAHPAAGPSGAGSGKTFGPGEGPGGVQLLRAQWYREPFDAELATYLPRRNLPPRSWATIACRTIDHYHVEDCRELSESPPGSGLSRALRQAAWQFLVRPPRIDGKAQLGTWVSIRFDFIRGESKDPGDAAAEDSSGAQ